MTYHIYHSTGENVFTETEDQPREFVGTVEADSLQGAFVASQNIDEEWNLEKDVRSTSVGDVIQEEEKVYMVCGRGFKLLDSLI